MGKVIVRILIWTVVSLAGLLLLASILLYIPSVQNFIKDKAAAAVSQSTGMDLSIGRLRLRFPLTLEADRTLLSRDGDTLLYNGRTRLSVAVWPLLAGEARVRDILLEETLLDYSDTLSALSMRGSVGKFEIGRASVGLKDNSVSVSDARIGDAALRLALGESAPQPQDTASALPAWSLDLDRLRLCDISFDMHTSPGETFTSVRLPRGELRGVGVDLAAQELSLALAELTGGRYSYLTDTLAARAATGLRAAEPAPAEDSRPWTVCVGRIALDDNSASYGVANGSAAEGFDPDHISVSELNLTLDSLRNRGADISFSLGRLSLRERSGIALGQGSGRFAMDSTGIALDNFMLSTPRSALRADVRAGAGITEMSSSTPLNADIRAGVDISEIVSWLGTPATDLSPLAGKRLEAGAEAVGTLSDLHIRRLSANIPGNVDLSAQGRVMSVADPAAMAGEVTLRGELRDLDFLKGFVADTALRRRVALPDMSLTGIVNFGEGTYSPQLALHAGSGSLELKGVLALEAERYEASLSAVGFPLQAFLPADSLGLLDMRLTAAGNGFDPRAARATADIGLRLDGLRYKGYDYTAIALDALLSDGRVTGKITGEGEAYDLRFGLGGTIAPGTYAADVTGRIERLDLRRMGLSAEPLGGSLSLGLRAEMRADTAYMAEVRIDSAAITFGRRTQRIGAATLTAAADPRSVSAAVAAADLSLDFRAESGPDSLMPQLAAAAAEIARQLKSRDLDMELMQATLPPFSLEASAGRGSFLRNMAIGAGVDFRRISLRARTTGDTPLMGQAVAEGLDAAGMTLDTLNVWLRREGKRLNYALRLRNRPGNIDRMALLRVRGSVGGNGGDAEFYQRDREGNTGFQFGIAARLLENGIEASMTPENPLFGYTNWSVNPDNYLRYDFDGALSADLRLTGDGRHFNIESARFPQPPADGVSLDMAGIPLGGILEMFPSMPQAEGDLAAKLDLAMDASAFAASGSLSLAGFAYEKRKVGDLAFEGGFRSDSLSMRIEPCALSLDGHKVLTASGTLPSADNAPMELKAALVSLPLEPFNAFLPEDMVQLGGSLSGNIAVGGTFDRPVMDGALAFADGEVTVPMTGTSYGILPAELKMASGRLQTDGFGLMSPNGNPLTVSGYVDMSDLSAVSLDLALRAVNFGAINSSRSSGAQVYGRADLDVGVRARGRLDALAVSGRIGLLTGTDVTYVMRDGPLEVGDAGQDLVTFVDFDRLDHGLPVDPAAGERTTTGIDMLLNIDIADDVRATVYLNESGENRVEVAGNGNLTYTLNNLGDSRFMGRYALSGGTVVYTPPVIAPKTFAVSPESYVEWTGEMLDPTFNISATETVTASVTEEGGDSRNVTFEISIIIRNSLNNMDLAFDLNAPSDIGIQNQLASLSAEQRSQQAMGLLVYNTYTGPGTTATVDVGNPLNTFIAKELNQWARNNIPGVEVSVGINTVDDGAGGEHTDYSYRVSKKLFDDRVTVTVGGSVSSDDDPSNEGAGNNFVDDIIVEYRLSKRDNMFLKAFRYNTQESILEGEVVETGGGFLIRKKMNSLGELFRLRRDPQKREVRRQKREEKRQNLEEGSVEEADPAQEQPQE